MVDESFTVTKMDSAEYYPLHQHENNIGLPLTIVENAQATMVIAEQGAHVLSFIPKGKPDLLWLSPKAAFVKTKAIRGGIPVCLPWFGVNQRDNSKPSHGFARNVDWCLEEVTQVDNDVNGGSTQLVFSLKQFSVTAHPLFDYCFAARLTFLMSDRLTIDVEVDNLAAQVLPFSWALHSYHPVRDLASVYISGLEQCIYLDNTNNLTRQRQEGVVVFDGELDRAYVDVGEVQMICDSESAGDAIVVAASESRTAIVWNPGAEKAAAMKDVGAENHTEFICLERGDAFDNEVDILAGETFKATVELFYKTESFLKPGDL